MKESDTDSILQPDAPTAKADYRAADSSRPTPPATCSVRSCRSCVGWITVEPAMILAMVSDRLFGPMVTQYLWDRFSQDLGYIGFNTSDCSHNSSDPLLKEVETLTAQWSLYITTVGFPAGLLMVPFLGSWSDVAGRRPVLLLSSLGLALQALICLLVIYLKLPLVYFLVSRIICGLSGDFTVLLTACLSYVADISDRHSRTIRVAVLEACLAISGILSGIIGGYWKKAQGVIGPFWFMLACNLASATYVYGCVGETVLLDSSAKFFSFRHYKSIWHLLSTGSLSSCEERSFRRHRLWLYMLCFFIVVTIQTGFTDLLVLYELSPPLCWDSTFIGIGYAVQNLAFITSLLSLKLAERCLVQSWMVLLGLVSNISALLVFSFAHTTAQMFTGYAVNLFYMTTTPVLRSKMSQLADPSQQGALFASVGFVNALCLLVASIVFNTIYPATLHIMKGFTFLCAAIFLLIPSGIIGYLQWSEKR